MMHPTVDPHAECTVMVTGLPASPGAAVGQVVFDADEAFSWAAEGKPVILVRPETLAGGHPRHGGGARPS